jgi:hypothetical protein
MGVTMPQMPVVQKPTKPEAAPAQPRLHPAVQQQVQAWSSAMEELDRVKADNSDLREALEIERRHCQELEHQLDVANRHLRDWMQYGTEISTHLAHIASSAIAARDCAAKATRSDSGEPVPADPLESNAPQIAAKFGAGKTNGAGVTA